jgi:hypothetical protein
MAFQFGADLEESAALKGSIRQFIQGNEDSESKGGTTAESARLRDLASDGTRKREWPDRGALEKCPTGVARHLCQRFPSSPGKRDLTIYTQRHAEAVESRAEIGGTRWNADGDLMHDR